MSLKLASEASHAKMFSLFLMHFYLIRGKFCIWNTTFKLKIIEANGFFLA